MPRRRPVEERFWEKVDQDGPIPTGTKAVGNCWDWTASTTGAPKRNYGQFTLSHQVHILAHVYAWVSERGPVPEGLFLDHICRRGLCVRPSHLRLATAAQNNQNQPVESSTARSGVRNVHWQPKRGKWQAVVVAGGKNHRGPLRATVAEAAEDAKELRLQWHSHNDVDR